jgi:crotonobetainyl-CoA:carnitine CoA-transferase CaiB-like acyl-CoA transferase
VFWNLIDTADLFIDGNRPGVCDRLGIGAEAMRARKPSLVYLQYTGYGAGGPYSPIPTHGMMMNALIGAHHVREDDDGLIRPFTPDSLGPETGGEATSVGALHAAMHAVAAVLRASRTGRGAHVDVAASDAAAMVAWGVMAMARNDHRVTDRTGMLAISGGELSGSRYQFYSTGDGKIVLFGCIEQRFWDRWAAAAGREDLVGKTAAGGNEAVEWGDDAERRVVADVMRTKDLEQWLGLAVLHGFALGPAHQTVAEVAADPHIHGRNVFVEGTHPVAGPISYLGSAAVIDGQRYSVRRHAPAPGEHSAEILRELGYSEASTERSPS